jgi:hypothetical protein
VLVEVLGAVVALGLAVVLVEVLGAVVVPALDMVLAEVLGAVASGLVWVDVTSAGALGLVLP